jgi:hypothetical protein
VDLQKLKDELTNDPGGIGYPARDDHAADAINALTRTKVGSVTVKELVMWAAEFEVLTEVDTRATVETQSKRKNVAKAALLVFRWPPSETVDIANPGFAALLDALQLDRAATAALKAMSMRACSRAEELGLGRVTASDVAKARR